MLESSSPLVLTGSPHGSLDGSRLDSRPREAMLVEPEGGEEMPQPTRLLAEALIVAMATIPAASSKAIEEPDY